MTSSHPMLSANPHGRLAKKSLSELKTALIGLVYLQIGLAVLGSIGLQLLFFSAGELLLGRRGAIFNPLTVGTLFVLIGYHQLWFRLVHRQTTTHESLAGKVAAMVLGTKALAAAVLLLGLWHCIHRLAT